MPLNDEQQLRDIVRRLEAAYHETRLSPSIHGLSGNKILTHLCDHPD
jgi:hypothetical protein